LTIVLSTAADNEGIFTGSDSIADNVIARGDLFLGSTVIDGSVFRNGLNASGQLAFFAELEDGRQGIFRADPVPAEVPERQALLSLVWDRWYSH
jgi:hypothetical protein